MTDRVTRVEAPADTPSAIFRRDFDAPPALIYAAWTEPDQIRAWRGPAELPVAECEVDLRVGAWYRIVHRGTDGHRYGFHGQYCEIDPPHLLVSTFVYDDAPQHTAVETVRFRAIGTGTRVRGASVFNSFEAREFYAANGMERGLAASHRRLDVHLRNASATQPPTGIPEKGEPWDGS